MNLINNIFSLLDGELKKYLLFIFIIIILTTILETLSLASFYPLLDLIINTSQIDSSNSIKIFYYKLLDYFSLDVSSILSFTIILVAALYIVKILVLLFCHWHSSNFEFAIRFYLTKKLYSIYLRKDYLSLMKYNSADIIKNIDYELNMYSSGIAALMTIVIEGLIFLGIILFLLYFNYQVTLSILLLFIFIFLLLQLSYNKTLVSWGAISQKYEKLRIQNFIETFNAIKEIKVFGKESIFYELMDRFNKNFFNVNRKEIFLKSVPRAFLELILILLASSYLLYVSLESLDVRDYFASIGIYLIAAYRTFPSATRILISLQRLKFATPFMRNVWSQLNNEKINAQKELIDYEKIKLNFNKKIEIKNCSFYFQNEKNKILDNLNINFEIGKIYGIKGPSGGGKTTLLNILSGLIYPKNGSLLIDSIEIDFNNLKKYQKFISYVPQSTFLFDASIAQNINFNLDEKTPTNIEKINKLINKLSLDEKISQLKDGINTRVGERGVNLSGGQIQRIGIARALYHEPKLLILDESTNAIEKDIEEKVVSYLSTIKKDKIIIIAAHRESAFKFCDKVFELKSGKLFSQ